MKKRLFGIIMTVALLMSFMILPISATDTVKLTVSSVTAEPGSEVAVTVSVSDNPGLASLKFDVAYDSYLTLTKVEFNGDFGALVTAPEPFRNPEPLTMISPLSDVSANGVFATLTFKVSEKIPAGHKAEVNLSYVADDIYDGDYNNVPVTVVNGAVNIAGGAIKGDVTGDGKINLADMYHIKSFIMGELVLSEAEMQAANINGDDKVNLADLFAIKTYLATGSFN